MKFAVLNFSGNVGKSTVAKFLLLPRFPEAIHIAVETINSDTGSDDNTIQLKGNNVEEVQEELLLNEQLIVDIGASNIEQFLTGMKLFEGSIQDFDRFIIPVTPENKQQVDTVSTVDSLLEMQVDPKKIKVVFNRVQPDMEVSSVFSALSDYLKSVKVKTFESSIPETPFFEKANDLGVTIEEILSDETDYRAMISDEKDRQKKLDLTAKIMLPRLANAIKVRLDDVAQTIL